jgi:hypothetical protein
MRVFGPWQPERALNKLDNVDGFIPSVVAAKKTDKMFNGFKVARPKLYGL